MITIIVARKPLDGTVASTVLKWGTGGLDIEASRIGTSVDSWPSSRSYVPGKKEPGGQTKGNVQSTGEAPAGRFPSNMILQHLRGCSLVCELGCPVKGLDNQSGDRPPSWTGKSCDTESLHTEGWGSIQGNRGPRGYHDVGGVSRFFKSIKP